MPNERVNHRDRVFGIILSSGEILFDTIKSNPAKALRAFRRLGVPPTQASLVEFSMKRKRQAGDVRGLTVEQLRKREPYIGPMR